MLQNDLILDLNLYLCEKFGYRNSCSVHAKCQRLLCEHQ